ncbi:Uncharacterised protein [Mycobacteroides abscessus subsp. abscessus]|nr:Uncharacterised protein [Mycobacteroides abscessus subsp. abscessus]
MGINPNRSRFVQVHHERMPRVGLHIVVVGDLGGSRVPDPTAGSHLGPGVLVSQRDVVNGATIDGILNGFQRDQRGLRRIRVEHVDTAVGHHYAACAVGR